MPRARSGTPPLSRLMGLETEYALRFSGTPHPGNDQLYRAILRAVSEFVHTRPGDDVAAKEQFFTENGGAFYYEHLPHAAAGGLLEGATPECRSPAQLLLYQKAQERLLLDALPMAALRLRGAGGVPELGLVKNCRDAENHVYGAQENYEVEIARGGWLGLYRAGLTLLLPWLLAVALVSLVVQLLLVLIVLGVALAAALVGLVFPRWRGLRWLAEMAEADESSLARLFGRSQLVLSYALLWPATTPLAILLELTAFRHLRRPLLAFLVSRPVLAGAGTVSREGHFSLAEKAPAIRRLMRRTISPHGRPIFDTGNLLKRAVAPMSFRLAPLFALYHRRQRLQLGYGDSNAAQWAEYLKIATTALVLDMAEAGELHDAPRPRQPLKALHALVADPTLETRIRLRRARAETGADARADASALELQRFYLERAEAFVRAATTASLEAREAVALWRKVLEALEDGRWQELLGRVDWITKRTLLEECRREGGADVLKTLDLRYHELGDGYLARLEAAGLAPVLVAEEEVQRAVRQPPERSPAFFRGELIRRQAGSRIQLRVSWDSAVIGGRLQGRIIRFRRPGDGSEGAEAEPPT